MSGPKHTPWAPGPWRVKELPHYKGKRRLVETASGRVVAEVPGSGWAPDTADANAQLIAAAPRLAEALRGLVHDVDWALLLEDDTVDERRLLHQDLYDQARAALRQAGVES